MGELWMRPRALLGVDALGVASDAPAVDRMIATALKSIYGARIAICDGAADQTEINAAIAVLAAAGGGVMGFTSGGFSLTDSVNQTSEITLQGAGVGATVFQWGNGGASDGKMINVSTGYKQSIKNIRTLASTYQCGYGIYASDVTQFLIENCNIWGETAPGSSYGLYLGGSNNNFVTIAHSRFYGQDYGARVTNTAYLAVTGASTFKSNGGYAFYGGDGYTNAFNFDGVQFTGTTTGTGVYGYNAITWSFHACSADSVATGVNIRYGRGLHFDSFYGEIVTGAYITLGSSDLSVYGCTIDSAYLPRHSSGQDVAIDVVNGLGINIQGVDCLAYYNRPYAVSWLRVGDNCQVNLGANPITGVLYHQPAPSIAAGAIVDGWHVPNLCGDLIEQSLVQEDSSLNVLATTWLAKVFTATYAQTLCGVAFSLERNLTPGTVTVSIRAVAAGVPDGADLTSGTTDGDTLLISGESRSKRRIVFATPISLVASTQYAIVIRAINAGTDSIDVEAIDYNDAAGHGVCKSTDSGGTWDDETWADYDISYELWGYRE